MQDRISDFRPRGISIPSAANYSSFSKQIGIDRSSLMYPPKEVAALGRVNRLGESVFYASMHKESVFFETQGLQAGDELVLAFWKTNEKMFVNNVGYTEYVFRQLGAKRPVPQWYRQQPQPCSVSHGCTLLSSSAESCPKMRFFTMCCDCTCPPPSPPRWGRENGMRTRPHNRL